jgi:hypothetical protein
MDKGRSAEVSVVELTGDVVVIDAQGAERVVGMGDKVLSGEMVITPEQGNVALNTGKAEPEVVPAKTAAVVEVDPQTGEITLVINALESESLDITAIQQAILGGQDPTEVLEETAAGNGEPTRSGFSEFESVDRTADEVIANAGFDTSRDGFELVEFPEYEEELLTEASDLQSPANEPPTIDVTANDFVEGGEGTFSGAVAGSYTTDDEDVGSLVVTFTAESNNDGYYALDTVNNQVTLTPAGVEQVNSGGALPAIDLTVTDSGDLSGSDSDVPVVTTHNVELATVNIAAVDGDVDEGATATFTVTRTGGDDDQAASVTLSLNHVGTNADDFDGTLQYESATDVWSDVTADAITVPLTGLNLRVMTTDGDIYEGTEGFTVTIDSVINGYTGTVLANGSITDQNQLPNSIEDSAAVIEGAVLMQSISVLDNDSDEDGGTLVVTQVAADASGTSAQAAGTTFATALGGSVVMNANGTYTYTAPQLEHTTDGLVEEDSFFYMPNDGTADGSWTKVTIDVADTVPVAIDDNTQVNADNIATGNVITDNDTVTVDSVTLTSVEYDGTTYTNFDASGNLTIPTDQGELIINEDGTYTYTSDLTSAYGGTDGTNDWSAVAEVFNGARTAVEDNEFFIDEFFVPRESTITGIGNGTGTLSFTGIPGDNDGVGVAGGAGSSGYLNGHPSNPEAILLDMGSEVTSFDLTAIAGTGSGTHLYWATYDGSGNIVEVSSGAVDNSLTTLHVDNASTEAFQYVVFYGTENSASGKFYITGISNISYLSTQPDEFTYTIEDSDGDVSSAVLTVDVQDNYVPVASSENIITNHDTLADVDNSYLLLNDSDFDGDALSVINRTDDSGAGEIEYQVTDGATSTAAVTSSVTFDNDNTLEGTVSSDLIIGADGNDILTGGSGDDILIGGLGADTFVWNSGDQGVSEAAVDIIKDFDVSEDVLDLSDMLDALGADSSVGISENNGNTVISVVESGSTTQDVVLEGVTVSELMSGTGAVSEADLLDKLVLDITPII